MRQRVWPSSQLIIGWIPVWALYGTLLFVMHQPVSIHYAAFAGLMAIVPAALLGLGVFRLTKRFPWPRPFRSRFVFMHVLFAFGYSVAWIAAVSIVQSVAVHRLVIAVGPVGATPFLILGVWLYIMVAGVSYSQEATERAARAEAAAVRAQLAALRSQLHPHFIFNGLHTVVQLIPREPARAAEAAEQLAQLLRTVVEEDRDVIRLAEEWEFVRRYLDIERIRFGDRLDVRSNIADDALAAAVPSFALQTLVENAVQHGAAPRVEPTLIEISASVSQSQLLIRVSDNGDGESSRGQQVASGLNEKTGTGISRLRERLAALYGTAASLGVESPAGRGFSASLTIPFAPAEAGEAGE